MHTGRSQSGEVKVVTSVVGSGFNVFHVRETRRIMGGDGSSTIHESRGNYFRITGGCSRWPGGWMCHGCEEP